MPGEIPLPGVAAEYNEEEAGDVDAAMEACQPRRLPATRAEVVTAALMQVLQMAGSLALHISLGFDTDALLADAMAIPVPKTDSVFEAAQALEPLLDWAIPERKWGYHWDTTARPILSVQPTSKTLALNVGPPISDMVKRVLLGHAPCTIVEPKQYPAPLGKVKRSPGNPVYPWEIAWKSSLSVGAIYAAWGGCACGGACSAGCMARRDLRHLIYPRAIGERQVGIRMRACMHACVRVRGLGSSPTPCIAAAVMIAIGEVGLGWKRVTVDRQNVENIREMASPNSFSELPLIQPSHLAQVCCRQLFRPAIQTHDGGAAHA